MKVGEVGGISRNWCKHRVIPALFHSPRKIYQHGVIGFIPRSSRVLCALNSPLSEFQIERRERSAYCN